MTLDSQLPLQTEPPRMTTYNARDLMRTEDQICLVLDDQKYFLRITRGGKLILTK